MSGNAIRYLNPRILTSVFAAGLMASVALHGAFAQASSSILRSKAADVDTLVMKAASPEGVRVLVTLKGASSGPDAGQFASSSTEAQAVANAGPLRDGQVATAEQAGILARHLGSDDGKRQRWSPRLIRYTPYMAMNVTSAELEQLASDADVVAIREDGQLQPGLQDSVPLIGMNAAYSFGATGTNMLVAVLDTGVQYGHVFVTPRVTNATCFSTTTATFSTLCPNGMDVQIGGTAGINCGVAGCDHGTHVAGIAAGNRASGTPMNGVAKNANIFSGQVFSRRNSDNALIAFDSDMLASLNDLLTRINANEFGTRRVAAINLSIWDSGMEVAGTCDTGRGAPFKSVIDSLRAANVATVIISGNGSKTNLSAFPGCVSTAVTVGSTTKADAVSGFSNISTVVDLLAPGSNITSSVPPTPNFAVFNGTSMAAPHVAGAFAAIRSVCPASTVAEIENALKATGLNVADTRAGGTFTRPRIRVNVAAGQVCGAGLVPACSVVSTLRDFHGDGRSDLIFRRKDGMLSEYQMDGFNVQDARLLGVIGNEWTLNAIGDVNGDGRADLLVRRTDGMLALYLMNGFTILDARLLGVVGNEWRLAGLADVNGDGRADMFFRRNDGTLAVFLMNGFTILDARIIGNVGTEWTLAGVGDVNGDARADMVFRRVSDGMLALFLMNGFNVIDARVLGVVGLEWRLHTVGDVNGDGRADLFFRRSSDGVVALFLMNGFNIIDARAIGQVGTEFTLNGVGDLNGDGRADMLFRRNTDGMLAIFLMNGFNILGAQLAGVIGIDWNGCLGPR